MRGRGVARREPLRVRPLPRLHAVTDAAVLAAARLRRRAPRRSRRPGSAVALHARDRAAGGGALARVALRLLALARPPEAAVFVNGRPDIAAGRSARRASSSAAPICGRRRRAPCFPRGWIGRSVHSARGGGARRAARAPTTCWWATSTRRLPSRPARPGARAGSRRRAARPAGDRDRRHRRPSAAEAREAGAYGVAAIAALWWAADPAAAALALLAPWVEAA